MILYVNDNAGLIYLSYDVASGTTYKINIEELNEVIESILKSQAFSRRVINKVEIDDLDTTSKIIARFLEDVVEELDLLNSDNRKKILLLSLLNSNDDILSGLKENYLLLKDLLNSFSFIFSRQDFKRYSSDVVQVLSHDIFKGEHQRSLESVSSISTDEVLTGIFDNDRILLTKETIYDDLYVRKNPSRIISIKLETNLSTRDLL